MSKDTLEQEQAQAEESERAEPDAGEQSPAADGGPEAEAGAETADVSAPEQDVQTLLAELELARKQAQEHWDTVLRTKAEMDNLKKRTARDLENAHKYGLEQLVSALLPVVDSIELGMAASENDKVDVASVREGMELTMKMITQALEKFGIEALNPLGESFDPEFHQAMSMQESEESESGTVLMVVQKGYLLNQRLVRPAMVIVAK